MKNSVFQKTLNVIFLGAFIFSPLFTITTNAQSYRGLIVNATIMDEGIVQPGSSKSFSFTVIHDFQTKDKQIKLYPRAANFTSDGVTGSPVFIEDPLPKEADLASWVKFEKDVYEMNSYGEKAEVKFTINVPAYAEPGSKYAAIILGDKEGEKISEDNSEGAKLGMSKELGPLLFMIVDGDLYKGFGVEEFYTTNIKGNKRSFFFNPPINVTTKITNTGNVHEAPKGAIYIYKGNDFQDYSGKMELNNKQGFVLPSTTRQFENNWDDSFISTQEIEKNGKTKYKTTYNWDKLAKIRFGKYNVKLLYTIPSMDGSATTQEAQTSFFVFPWQFVMIILIVILVIIYLGWNRSMETKSNKKK